MHFPHRGRRTLEMFESVVANHGLECRVTEREPGCITLNATCAGGRGGRLDVQPERVPRAAAWLETPISRSQIQHAFARLEPPQNSVHRTFPSSAPR